MNKYFDYPEKKYWDAETWAGRRALAVHLADHIAACQTLDDKPYENAPDGLYGEDCRKLSFYDRKTNCVSIPEVVKYWNDKGLHYERRSMGGVGWVLMAPKKCFADFGNKLPVLMVLNYVDIVDPYWAMKTLDTYKEYNEMLAQQQDFIIIYIAFDERRRCRTYSGCLQESFVFAPEDAGRVYMDVSAILKAGKTIKEAEGFIYKDDDGNVVDPDTKVFEFGSAKVPVLDISGRWSSKHSLSREQLCVPNSGRPGYDVEKIINSETGRRMAEGMYLEHAFSAVDEPGFVKYWADRGLVYESHETKFRRWKSAVPKAAFENPEKKLPVMCVLHEVNCSNDYLAVISASFFYEYFRLAAQGECVVINFVLEDMESNELLVDILHEAFEMYPMIDRSRVYVGGHSHNGRYSLEFAMRHPDMVAAVATFGNNPGLSYGQITEIDDEKIDKFSKVDVPTINLAGYHEDRIHFPLSTDAVPIRPGQRPPIPTFQERAESWQLRLRAHNCPMKTIEEIAACQNSPEGAIRKLGIPGDKSEVLFLDGFEIYIVDIKNNDGKYHLRMVGEDNLPHNTSPNQQNIAWSFMRRFARDLETGECIELY